MSADDEKLRIKLRKLLALAERGVGGERENAKRFLATLLRKNGLTLDDLQSEERTEACQFTFKSALERKLLVQILCVTLGQGVITASRYRGRSRMLEAQLTKAQRLHVELAFSVYRQELEKNVDRMLRAFFATNDLYPPTEETEAEDDTPVDPAELLAIAQMMAGMTRVNIRPALPAK